MKVRISKPVFWRQINETIEAAKKYNEREDKYIINLKDCQLLLSLPTLLPMKQMSIIRNTRLLEQRQYKNGLASVENMFVLKLPPIFTHQDGKGKRAAISKLACVSQKRIRSYIVLALGCLVSIFVKLNSSKLSDTPLK